MVVSSSNSKLLSNIYSDMEKNQNAIAEENLYGFENLERIGYDCNSSSPARDNISIMSAPNDIHSSTGRKYCFQQLKKNNNYIKLADLGKHGSIDSKNKHREGKINTNKEAKLQQSCFNPFSCLYVCKPNKEPIKSPNYSVRNCDIDDLLDSNSILNTNNEKEASKNEKLKEIIRNQRNQIKKLKEKLRASITKQKQFEENYDKIASEKSKLEDERSKIASDFGAIKDLEEEIKDKTEQNKAYEVKITETNKDIDKMKDELNLVKLTEELLFKTQNEYKEEVKRIKAEYKEVCDRYEEKIQEYEENIKTQNDKNIKDMENLVCLFDSYQKPQEDNANMHQDLEYMLQLMSSSITSQSSQLNKLKDDSSRQTELVSQLTHSLDVERDYSNCLKSTYYMLFSEWIDIFHLLYKPQYKVHDSSHHKKFPANKCEDEDRRLTHKSVDSAEIEEDYSHELSQNNANTTEETDSNIIEDKNENMAKEDYSNAVEGNESSISEKEEPSTAGEEDLNIAEKSGSKVDDEDCSNLTQLKDANIAEESDSNVDDEDCSNLTQKKDANIEKESGSKVDNEDSSNLNEKKDANIKKESGSNNVDDEDCSNITEKKDANIEKESGLNNMDDEIKFEKKSELEKKKLKNLKNSTENKTNEEQIEPKISEIMNEKKSRAGDVFWEVSQEKNEGLSMLVASPTDSYDSAFELESVVVERSKTTEE